MLRRLMTELFAAIDLAFHIGTESLTEYWRRWPAYIGTIALGWWSLIALEIWAIARFGGPVLAALEPVLFRPALAAGFNMAQATAGLDLQTLLSYLLLTAVLALLQTLVIQNIVLGGLINVASRPGVGPFQAFLISPLRYIGLVGVSLLTAICVLLPSLLLFAGFVGVVIIAPDATGLWRLLGQALILLSFLTLIPAIIFFTIRFALGPQAVMIEGRNSFAAVGHSWQMLGGVSGALSVFILLILIAAPNFFLALVVPQIERDVSWLFVNEDQFSALNQFLVSHALSSFFAGLIMPLQAITMTLLFRYHRQQQLGAT